MPDGTPAIVDLTGDDGDDYGADEVAQAQAGAGDVGYRDPTPAELAAADTDQPTPLEELEAELTTPLDADPIRVEVKGRDGWVALYRRDFTGKDIRRWRKQSKVNTGRRDDDEIDEVKLAGLTVSLTLIGLEKNGKPVDDPEVGGPLTLSSAYLQRVYGAGSAIDAARRFFGGDGYLCGQANTVLEEAGWGGYADVADPS